MDSGMFVWIDMSRGVKDGMAFGSRWARKTSSIKGLAFT
jgi:hypothetical protein